MWCKNCNKEIFSKKCDVCGSTALEHAPFDIYWCDHCKTPVELYEYQKEAIANWVSENYRGIFDMATGTGKTLTGLGAVSKLSEIHPSKRAVKIFLFRR